MNTYAAAFLVTGVVIPTVLHFFAREAMPWWPDTVSMGIAFGATAIVIVWKNRTDRQARQRLWTAFRGIGEALGRSWMSR